MITVAELKAIPLLADVDERELAHLAGNVPDIHLQQGEYAAHEGEDGVLFIIIEGQCEVTKFHDGIERIVGIRNPGDLFGEVPVVLNTPFVASMRAKIASRVIRVETPEYHHLAAASPKLSATVTASALDRVGGLQELAAERSEPEVVIVGPRWDAGCYDLRDFLQRNQVVFEWERPEEQEGCTPERIASERYPIVRLRDGRVLVQPTKRDIAKAVGLSIAPAQAEYDVVIVGGGPAGMAAALYGASEGLRTVLIERQVPGGQAGQSSRIENYLGFPVGVSGGELARRAFAQAKRFGAEIIVTREVKHIDLSARAIELDGNERLHARTIILALGVAYRRLAVKGGDQFTGRGIFYGAARSEASSTQGQDIYLIGAGNSAAQAAMFFANHAKTVTLIVRGDSLAKSMSYYLIEQLKTKPNIRVELNSEVTAVYGDEHLDAIDVADRSAGSMTRRETPALFVFIGADTDTAWLPDEIARDARGFVLTGADVLRTGLWTSDRQPYLLETSVAGVFAAGDIRAGSVKRVAAGVGEGSMAIAFVHQYLQTQDPALASAT